MEKKTLKNGNPIHTLTEEELRKGGINSGIARSKKNYLLYYLIRM